MTDTQDITIESNVHNLELYSDSHPFRLTLRIKNFQDEPEQKKFIKNCEKLIRSCNEYRLWKGYIIDVLQVQACMITNENINDVSLDVHHHIPSLYMLVSALVNKKIEGDEEFCSFDIATDAIKMHYMNRIGYLVLSRTIHEKIHNNALSIPINLLKGNYQYFVDNYSRYLEESDLEIIHQKMSVEPIENFQYSWSQGNYPGLG